MKPLVFVLLMALQASFVHYEEYLPVNSQDEAPVVQCHDDEDKVSDSRGGMKCIPKKKFAQYNAKECIKDFKPKDETLLVIPLDDQGNMQMDKARLENFEFKFVCPVIRKGEQ